MATNPHDPDDDRPWLGLATLNQESRFHRRGFEWKLAIEFWGFAIGIPLLLWKLNITTNEMQRIHCQSICWYVLAGISFIVSAFATHRAHTKDLEFLSYYTKRAIGRKDVRLPESDACCWLSNSSVLWFVSKTLFTIAVLWASCAILLLLADRK